MVDIVRVNADTRHQRTRTVPLKEKARTGTVPLKEKERTRTTFMKLDKLSSSN
jgi:hypothetical protein